MSGDELQDKLPVIYPSDAITVRQSVWAWLWAAIPWVVFVAVALSFDFISFGILPLLLAAMVILPRYLGYRKTAYILTNEYLTIHQGSMMGKYRYDLPMSEIGSVTVQPGPFGTALGYAAVHLELKDGQVAILRYVPLASQLVGYVQTRIGR